MVNTELCKSGKNQSPINIKTRDIKKCQINCNLTFYYKSSRCLIKNINNNLILDYDQTSHVIFNDTIYNLDIISFTVPSSHKIDNKNYDMEAMIYHVSPATNNKLVISVMVNIDDNISMSSKFFDIFKNGLPKNHDDEVFYNTDSDWNIFNILPEKKSFFSYDGSLINTPCTENVTYIVMENNVTISPKIYNKIKNVTKYNARQIMPLNKRVVLYNDNLSGKNNMNHVNMVTEKMTDMVTDDSVNTRNKCKNDAGSKKNTFKYLVLLLSVFIIFLLFFILFVQSVKAKYSSIQDISLLNPSGFSEIMTKLKPFSDDE